MKLKPCPFCGSSATAKYEILGIETEVECDGPDCYAVMRGVHAIEAWNKRHNEPPVVDEVPPLDAQRREVA